MLAVGQIIAFLSRLPPQLLHPALHLLENIPTLSSPLTGAGCPQPWHLHIGCPDPDIYWPVPGPGLPWPWLLRARCTGHRSQEEDSSLLQHFCCSRRRRWPAFSSRSLRRGVEWVCDNNSRVSTWSGRRVYLNELDPKNGNHKSKIIPLAAKNVWFNIFR